MRYPAITFALILLSQGLAWAAASGQPLETQMEKESYSIGYQVGLSMTADGVKTDFPKLIQGLRDAIDKKEPLLSNEEMKDLIVALKEKARAEQIRKIQEIAVKNAEESEKFLRENGKKAGVKTTESGLQYRIIREGNGKSPKSDDLVKVNYRGTFIDGEEFDSSEAHGAPQSVLTNGVIKGWEEAFQMMKEGSKWEIFVPPHLAYGRGGLGTKIPPNKVLVFELELLAIDKQKEAAVN